MLLRPVQMTVAPAAPRPAAIPRPAPRVAPATTATRPRSDPAVIVRVSRVGAGARGLCANRWRTRGQRAGCTGILARVTPMQRYIAEEIATDHVDGLMSRREALRRMALLGVSTAAATALIAACGDNKKTTSNAPVTSSGAATSPSVPPGSAKALPTKPITWAG